MQQLRLGIIGTGVAARILHWPALRELSDQYRIVAVANRTRSKGEAFADMVGLDRSAVYGDYRDLLARGDVDVVDLALPPAMNAEVATTVAKAGVHVICEKPMATDLEAARAIASLSERYDVRVLVAENFRYENSIREARALLDDGVIQPPFMISYTWMQPVAPDDEIASRPWRRNPEHAGGFLSDHGVHMIDVVRYLMGDPTAVHAFGLDRSQFLTGLDNAVFNLAFRSGAVGSIHWSFTVNPALTWFIQLWSADGTLTIHADQIVLTRQGERQTVRDISGPSSFVNEFEDFYQAIVHGKPPEMTVDDGLADLRTILAAYDSIVRRDVISLESAL